MPVVLFLSHTDTKMDRLTYTGSETDKIHLKNVTCKEYTWAPYCPTGNLLVDFTISNGEFDETRNRRINQRLVFLEEIIPILKLLHQHTATRTPYDPPREYTRMVNIYKRIRLSDGAIDDVEFKLVQYFPRKIFVVSVMGLNAIINAFNGEYIERLNTQPETDFKLLMNQCTRRLPSMAQNKESGRYSMQQQDPSAGLPPVVYLQDGNRIRLFGTLSHDGENIMQATVVFVDPDISTRKHSREIASGFAVDTVGTVPSSRKRKKNTQAHTTYTTLSNSANKLQFMRTVAEHVREGKLPSFDTKMHLSNAAKHFQVQHGKRLPCVRVKTYRHVKKGVAPHPNVKSYSQYRCFPESMTLGLNPVVTCASDRGEGGVMCNQTCKERTAEWDPCGETNFMDQDTIQLSTFRTWDPVLGSVAAFRFNVIVVGESGDKACVEFQPINPMWHVGFVRGKLSSDLRPALREDMGDLINPEYYAQVTDQLSPSMFAWLLVQGPKGDKCYSELERRPNKVSVSDATTSVQHNRVPWNPSEAYSWTFPPFPERVAKCNTPVQLGNRDPIISTPRQTSIVPNMIRGDTVEVLLDTGGVRNAPEGPYIAGQVVHSIQNHHTMCASRMMGSKVHGAETPWTKHGNVRIRSAAGFMWGVAFGDSVSARPVWSLEKSALLRCCTDKCNQQRRTAADIILSQQDRLQYTSLVAMIDIHTMTISPGPDHGTPTTMVVDDPILHFDRPCHCNPLWKAKHVIPHVSSLKYDLDGPVVDFDEYDLHACYLPTQSSRPEVYDVVMYDGTSRQVRREHIFEYVHGERIPYRFDHTGADRAVVVVLHGTKARHLKYLSEKIAGMPRHIPAGSDIRNQARAYAGIHLVEGTTSILQNGKRKDLHVHDPISYQLPQPYVARWDKDGNGRFETDVRWLESSALHLVNRDKKSGLSKHVVVPLARPNSRSWKLNHVIIQTPAKKKHHSKTSHRI